MLLSLLVFIWNWLWHDNRYIECIKQQKAVTVVKINKNWPKNRFSWTIPTYLVTQRLNLLLLQIVKNLFFYNFHKVLHSVHSVYFDHDRLFCSSLFYSSRNCFTIIDFVNSTKTPKVEEEKWRKSCKTMSCAHCMLQCPLQRNKETKIFIKNFMKFSM